MAVQTIYTGENYVQVPQTRGYAMQALSQFSQQQQARQTFTLQQAYKDRDTFAKMLELDPVYASSQAAEKHIAGILDGYLGEMALMNKNRIGPLTTRDLVGMNQARSRAMAEMNYIKGASDEFIAAAKAYNAAPDKYDEETFTEYKNTWLRDGTRPEGPALLPAAEDAIVVGLRNLEDYGLKKSTTEATREVQPGGTEAKVGLEERWNVPDDVPLEDIISRSYTQQQPWNIYKTFNSKNTPQAEKDLYMKMANGDKDVAANLWYVKKMKENLDQVFTFHKTVRVPQGSISPVERENMKTRFSSDESVYLYDNDAVFQKGYQDLAIGKSGEGFAILKPSLINIPADNLEFNGSIAFDKGSRVWVQPQQVTFKDGKVEYAVDPTKNGEVWIIADKEADVPLDKIMETQPLPNGKMKYRGRLKALTALGDVEKAKPLMPYNFATVYDKWESEWKTTSQGKTQEPATKEQKGFKWLNPSTWFSNESTNAVFDIKGEQYTEQELKDGGWSDAQISQLKKEGNE